MTEFTEEEITAMVQRYLEKHPLPKVEPFTITSDETETEEGFICIAKIRDNQMIELVERLTALESDRDEWKAKAEALESDMYLISGELEFSAMCKICKYEHGTKECTERFNNHVKQGKDCFEWRGVEKESK